MNMDVSSNNNRKIAVCSVYMAAEVTANNEFVV